MKCMLRVLYLCKGVFKFLEDNLPVQEHLLA